MFFLSRLGNSTQLVLQQHVSARAKEKVHEPLEVVCRVEGQANLSASAGRRAYRNVCLKSFSQRCFNLAKLGSLRERRLSCVRSTPGRED